MNILVINAFLLPFFLESKNLGVHSIVNEEILKDTSTQKDFDEFLYDSSKEIFKDGKNYDLIVLPYSLNRDNLMENSGLRLACLVRLTSGFRHQGVPFLFMGAASTEEINRIDKLGSILYTPRIYTTQTNDETEFLSLVEDIFSLNFSKDTLTNNQYKSFLNRVHIEAPSNYGTHHSIANEWAITRWKEMFNWNGMEPNINEGKLSSMLYFKWLLEKETANNGARESFNKRKAKVASVPGLPTKSRIVYIDDEGVKGWTSILSIIFKNSNVEFIPYDSFKKVQSKDEMVADIMAFIDKTPANCYIIDLRLHDEDFNDDVKELSGHTIARYIRDQNIGNQIVIFTASNKTWNYQISQEIGAVGYALKESPEYNYTKDESYENFCHFAKLVRSACNNSYICKYVEELRKYPKHPLLENCIELLKLDDNKTIRANALNLAVFLESYLDGSNYSKGKFRIEAGKLKLSNEIDQRKSVATYNANSIIIREDRKDVKFYPNPVCPCPKDYQYLSEASRGSLSVILIALRYYYGISDSLCNLVLKLRYDRNETIAHYHNSNITLTLEDIKTIFEKVILKILDKDCPA